MTAFDLFGCATVEEQVRPSSKQPVLAGYCTEENLKELSRRHIRGYVATSRRRHEDAVAQGLPRGAGPRAIAMRTRLRRGGYRSRYGLRKQTAEPVIGNLMDRNGLRQFMLRGLAKIAGEWSLACTAHNLLKLAAARGRSGDRTLIAAYRRGRGSQRIERGDQLPTNGAGSTR